jgi:bilirubin oxidase
MRFDVSSDPVADSSTVPTTLRSVPPPPPPTDVVSHQFRFAMIDGVMTINNVTFSNVENRVLAKPQRGTVEIWELINNSTALTHPVHLHLVDFKILNCTKVDGEPSRGVAPYEAVGLKDVVWLGVMENVTVEALYTPWDGVYMFQCHNLIHEDNDLMGVFNVTTLENLGYNETTDFSDSMDARWRSQLYDTADFTGRTGIFSDDAITEKVEKLAREQPYSEEEKLQEALTTYWNEHNSSTPVQSRSVPAPRRRRFMVQGTQCR